MEAHAKSGEQKNASRLEFGKAVIGCLSAIVVACISGTVGIVTNWDKVQQVWASFNFSDTLFNDEFSDVNSGWDRYIDEDTGNITDYEDGSYRIFVNEPNITLYTNPGKSFSNAIIKVNTQYAGGPEDNFFGVQCRFQDVDNHYQLIISSDGYYGIERWFEGEFTQLGAEQMQFSEEIHLGEMTNQIQAECVKNRLALYANGHKLLEVTDDTLPQSGDIGLLAGSYDVSGVDIRFDHLSVKKP